MTPAGQGRRILVVEDEAIISLDIRRLLSSSGYEIAATAATAEQAIRAVETSSPDLVLMDIHLKGSKDGVETAMYIHNRFHLPLVFVTAHADKVTLERARQTEPFGYIVKPISALSLTSTIEMALHKHRIERQLEEHRAWLTTVLETIPEAVLVSDLGGEVQFVNAAAGELLGVTQREVVGCKIDDVASLSTRERANLASYSLDQAEWGNRVSFPKTTVLNLGEGRQIPVEGDVVISYRGDQPAGAIFTLRDISRREQEESIQRQEERMLALGRLANSVAHDFNSLHNLLTAANQDLAELAPSLTGETREILLDKIDTIGRVNRIGLLMTEQLITVSEQPKVRASLVSASGVVAAAEPLLNKLAAGNLQVDIHLTDESTLVLCHPDRLSVLLVNVFLNARERLSGQGRVRVSTMHAPGNRIAIVFDLEEMGPGSIRPLSFPLQMENPDFSLSIAHALVAAMEGSIAFTPLSDKQGRIEIFLPQQFASPDLIETRNRRGTALLLGSDLHLFGGLEESLSESRFGVIRCASAAEALLLGQFYDSKIDFIVCDAAATSLGERRKVRTFFASRNPDAGFVRLVSGELTSEQGWQTLTKQPENSFLERLRNALGIEDRGLKAAGGC